ncbi:nitroreductase [Pseudofrancisella aestuarii]|uniref:Nitroreductase n=1 Tax=Pseudofrancisella aestuarii TaxID=2670347 RepID=A0ABV9TCG0_9GAMM|nr:nitroreductase [Pseudofrancisella aestuarii]
MTVIESLKTRKSVRAFLDKDIPKETLEKMFDAVKWTPSAKDTQPWKIAVVSGEKQKKVTKRILKAFESGQKPKMEYEYEGGALEGELKARAIACGAALYDALDIKRDDKEKRMEQWKKNYLSFDAPVTLFFFKYSNTGASAYIDCGMLLQSVMLAANELGLATCPQASLGQYPEIVKEELGYDDFVLLFGVSLGYEDKGAVVNNYRTAREDIDSFVTLFN